MPLVNRLEHQYGLPAGVINTQPLHRHEIATRSLSDRLLQRLDWPTQRLARYQLRIAQAGSVGFRLQRFQRREIMPALDSFNWGQPHQPATPAIQRSGVALSDASNSCSDLSPSHGRPQVPDWSPPLRVKPGVIPWDASMAVRRAFSDPAPNSPVQTGIETPSSPTPPGTTDTVSASIPILPDLPPASASIPDVSPTSQSNNRGSFRIQRRARATSIPLSTSAESVASPSIPLAATRPANLPSTTHSSEPIDQPILQLVVTSPVMAQPATTASPVSPFIDPHEDTSAVLPPLHDGEQTLPPIAIPRAVASQPSRLVQRYALTEVMAPSPEVNYGSLPSVRPLIQRWTETRNPDQPYLLGSVLMDSRPPSNSALSLPWVAPNFLSSPLQRQPMKISGEASQGHEAGAAEVPVVRLRSNGSRSQGPAQPLPTASHLQAMGQPHSSLSLSLARSTDASPVATEPPLSPLPLAIRQVSQALQRQADDIPEVTSSEPVSHPPPPTTSQDLTSNLPIGAEDMADQVSRILARQLAVELERRGLER
jgi:hypothetical protein